LKNIRRALALLLGCSILAYGQGNTFDKVRYNGGSIQTKVDPKSWENRLTIDSDRILLELKDGQNLSIDPKRVTGLSYGQEAHRRVGTMIALGILLAPLALFGLFHKTRLHFIGIEFTTGEGKKSGVLLQGDKDNYRGILMALRGVTGAKVAVSAEDRKYIPVGVEATTVSESESSSSNNAAPSGAVASPSPAAAQPTGNPQGAAPAPAETVEASPARSSEDLTTAVLKSDPAGADVTLDGKYMGSTPSTVRLTSGDHTVLIEKAGYKPWQRTVTVNPGGIVSIDAALEKNP
jgi:hypothetical protein